MGKKELVFSGLLFCATCNSVGCFQHPKNTESRLETSQFTETDFELRVTALVSDFINRHCESNVALGKILLENTNTGLELVYIRPDQVNVPRPIKVIIPVDRRDEDSARSCAEQIFRAITENGQCQENPTAPVGPLSA